MKNKILIISGHPDKESFNYALADAYKKGAEISSSEVELINICDLQFNLNLQYGYRNRTDLEPDLLDAQDKIKWADHIVWVYPVWWGSVPAIMKGFIDRVFLPGFAFKKKKDSVWWDKYLKGKSARIITTMDQPTWYYRLVYKAPSHNAMKKLTMQFCGVQKVGITAFGPVRGSKANKRKSWLQKVKVLGEKNK